MCCGAVSALCCDVLCVRVFVLCCVVFGVVVCCIRDLCWLRWYSVRVVLLFCNSLFVLWCVVSCRVVSCRVVMFCGCGVLFVSCVWLCSCFLWFVCDCCGLMLLCDYFLF